MLAALGQALDALSAEIDALIAGAGLSPAPEILILSTSPRLSGIGGFVGLNDTPRAELYARTVEAEVAVRVLANNSNTLATAEAQATNLLLRADPAVLRQAGIFRMTRLTERETPVLRGSDGISANFGRDLIFAVTYEHKPVPAAAEGVLGSVPADVTMAGLTARGRTIYDSEFETDPLLDFLALDRAGGTGTAGAWAHDAAAREVTQTGTASGGNNGIAGNKVGTYLVLAPGAGGSVTNFVAHAEMRCGATGGIGFVFRFADIENFGFVVLESPADVRVMGKRIAGTGTLLDAGGQDDTQGFPPDTWIRLRLLADGDRFELAVNERTVLSGRDASLTGPGSVGLFCRRADTARFRRFRLASL
jgi:hypothetical protein